MKKSLTYKQQFSNLRTEVIDQIRELVKDKMDIDDNNPTYTEKGDGVCGTVDILSIINDGSDIIVYGYNNESDEDVETNVVDIELNELIDLLEFIENN